jgi:hypothetical protein
METNTYVNLKMRTGEDIVAVFEEENELQVTIRRPLQVMVSPSQGVFVKSWNLLSVGGSIKLNRDDMLWLTEANDSAVEYYTTFLQQIDEGQSNSGRLFNDYDDELELEEAFETLLESKLAIKH